MQRYLTNLCLALACGLIMTSGVTAQPPDRPQPLSAEFQKQRQANSYFQLGRILLGRQRPGDLAQAVANFEKAASTSRELGDLAGVGTALLGVGLAQRLDGKKALAAQTYEQALATFRAPPGVQIGERTLAHLGYLYNELVDKRTGFAFDELSIKPPPAGFDQNGDRIDTRFSQTDARYPVQFFNQSFVVNVDLDPVREDPRFAGSNEQKTVSFYRDVLAIWDRNGKASLDVAVGINLMAAWATENPRVAVFYGKRAINEYQQIRQSMAKSVNARRYVNQLADKYRILADLLIGLGRLAEADEVLQMLKEEEFSQFVGRDVEEMKGLDRRVRLTAKERQVIDRYILLAGQAAEIGKQFQTLEDKKTEGKPLSTDEEKSYDRLSREVANINAAFKLFLEKELVNEIGTDTAGALQSDLSMLKDPAFSRPGVVMLSTVVTPSRYRVVMTTPSVQIDAKTEIDAALLNKKIYAFRAALQNTEIDPRPLGKELYDILLKPIEKQLAASGATTLVWSLDGTLRYIPFGALSPDGKTYLVERFQNVTLTARTRDRVLGKSAEWKALGMGVSEEQTVGYPENPGKMVKVAALPGARNELMAIVRDEDYPAETGILDGKRFLDRDFTLLNLTDSLARRNMDGSQKFTVVHIASHFQLGSNWSNSYLFLGNGKLLSMEEFSKSADIKFSGVELVTLSACKTAIMTTADGYEVDSLADTIQAKSGKAVLATLWDVYDQSTVKLMTDFYRARKADPQQTKAGALQQAQKTMIAGAYSHPYYWAGFVLTGNWS